MTAAALRQQKAAREVFIDHEVSTLIGKETEVQMVQRFSKGDAQDLNLPSAI